MPIDSQLTRAKGILRRSALKLRGKRGERPVSLPERIPTITSRFNAYLHPAIHGIQSVSIDFQ